MPDGTTIIIDEHEPNWFRDRFLNYVPHDNQRFVFDAGRFVSAEPYSVFRVRSEDNAVNWEEVGTRPVESGGTMSLTLEQTKKELRELRSEKYPNGVEVAIDLGVHAYCLLNSNCPEAIKLRRIMQDAEINTEEFVQGVMDKTSAPRPPVTYAYPVINTRGRIEIAGKPIDLDLEDCIVENLRRVFDRRVSEFQDNEHRVHSLANSLYRNYAQEVERQRHHHTLPQVSYDTRTLLENRVTVTSFTGDDYMRNTYNFIFRFNYHPRWIFDGSTKYELHPGDEQALQRPNWNLSIPVSDGNKVYCPDLLDEYGNKAHHYHGDDGGDCWGDTLLLAEWNRTNWRVIRDYVQRLENMLATINGNSLVTQNPATVGFPEFNTLLEHAKILGTEGESSGTPRPRQTRWGGRRTT